MVGAVLVALAAPGLVACSAADPSPVDTAAAQSSIRSLSDLDGMSVVEIVDTLEAIPVDEQPTAFTASVRPGSLLLADDDGEEERAMPAGVFHLSVAPYVDGTHDCFFHSLTTCRGELGGRTLEVAVTASDGTVLFDETVIAEDNGYVGLWLPSDIDATLRVSDGERSGEIGISTGPDDLTCLTSLQLT